MYHINKGSTKAELIAALKAEGYDADEKATRDELLTLLSQLTGTDYEKFSASAKAEPKAQSQAEPKRIIVIPSGESKVNQGDVFVGHNGVTYQLKRDTEIEAPPGVLDALRSAKQKVGIQQEDGSLTYREVLAYPFNVVG
jgi:hypothetical protein